MRFVRKTFQPEAVEFSAGVPEIISDVLYFTGTASQDYLVFWSCEVQQGTVAQDVRVGLWSNGTGTWDQSAWFDYVDTSEWRSAFGVYKHVGGVADWFALVGDFSA